MPIRLIDMADHPESAIPGCSRRHFFDRKPGITRISSEAAAFWESLGQNHPFFDGSTRTAFAATYTFLAINGVSLTASADEGYAFISGLYERVSFRFEALVPWLRSHTAR